MTVLGCAPKPPPNIVVLVLDTARPDLLSVYGHSRPTSPFLASFTRAGIRFDRAYSSSSWTLPAHGSLFTGMPPKVHQANQTTLRVADSLPLLPEQLREVGYQTAGFSGNRWVSELGGFDRGFDHFEHLTKRAHARRLGTDRAGTGTPPREHYVAGRVCAWLARKRDPGRPFFLFVNLVDSHIPYVFPWEAGRHFLSTRQERWDLIQRYFPKGAPSGYMARHYTRRRPYSGEDWDALARMYESTLRVVDEVAGAIVAAVDAVSDPQRTLIFIVSDHGENLGDHDHVGHIFNLYDSNLRIVCLARGPGFPAGHAEENLVHIEDLHATALAAAGVRPESSAKGLDLRRGVPEDRILSATLEYPSLSLEMFPTPVADSGALDRYKVGLRAAVGPRFKLIVTTDQAGIPIREEFFDLINDPRETIPLSPSSLDPETVRGLRVAARGSQRRSVPADTWPLDGLDEATLEGLRALGYVP